MTKRIIIRPQASQDLDDYFAYIAEHSFEVALQFFDSTRSTIAQLARMPGMGSLYPVENSRLQGLRKWAVKDFRKYLIFYFERDDVAINRMDINLDKHNAFQSGFPAKGVR